jgi:cysteine desulfurase family protein
MIYFDNAATTFPKPAPVYETINEFIRTIGVGAGRSAHRQSVAASRAMFETRELLARLFGVHDAGRIVFTSGATESLNLAIFGTVKPGDRVVTSSLEHNAVMRPLRVLVQQSGVMVDAVPCAADGRVDLEKWEAALRKKPAVAVVNHGSNVTGAIAPIGEIGGLCRKYGVRFIVDAAQTAGIADIDVDEANIDFLAFSGHKSLYGLPGTGGLFIREGCDPEPLKYGGTGSRSESDEQPLFLPDRYESGTQNMPGIVSLGAGTAFVLEQGVSAIRAHGGHLAALFIEGLQSLPGVRTYGAPDTTHGSLPVVSMTIDGIDNGILAQRFSDEFDIAVRAGLHCAPQAHRTTGTFPDGTVRISFGFFNTEEECVLLLDALNIICGK